MEAGGARTLASWLVAVSVVACIGLLLVATPAHAETFTVNSTGDAGDSNIGDGSCFTGIFVQVGPRFERQCTLRAAIQQANPNGQSDTIGFAPGLSGTITLGSSRGGLVIANDTPATDDLNIQGPGAEKIAVSGNDATEAF